MAAALTVSPPLKTFSSGKSRLSVLASWTHTTVAGFDWGARTADVMAVLWPERCKAIVSVSGYLISSPAGNQTPWPPQAAFAFWYQYYFATEVGKAGYAKYLDEFNKFIWHQASPKWNFDDATYNRAAAPSKNRTMLTS
jgi:pimeloyl-ACP methyl ester carboxylesterase